MRTNIASSNADVSSNICGLNISSRLFQPKVAACHVSVSGVTSIVARHPIWFPTYWLLNIFTVVFVQIVVLSYATRRNLVCRLTRFAEACCLHLQDQCCKIHNLSSWNEGALGTWYILNKTHRGPYPERKMSSPQGAIRALKIHLTLPWSWGLNSNYSAVCKGGRVNFWYP